MSESPTVLNPTLYRALVSAFCEVRVARAGEPFEARRVADQETDWTRLEIIHYGESYKVCCPFCHDRRFQLNVNHRYANADKRLGRPLDFLATCFAHGCLKTRSNRERLFELVDRGRDVLAEASVLTGSQAPPVPSQLPHGHKHLRRLPQEHPARALLREHGFDPDQLGREFRVGYCGDSDELLARESVIAPVMQGDELAGWLAVRWAAGGPTFLCAPGMRAGRLLYHLDQARRHPLVIVVPSPDWVWRLGTSAVAPISGGDPDLLLRTLSTAFAKKDVVVVTPPGTRGLDKLTMRLAMQFGTRFADVRLSGRSTGSDREALHEMIRTAAAKRGLSVAVSDSRHRV